MFTTLFETENIPREPEHREGELYRMVTTYGKTFELRYGYYGEKDRHNPLCQPAVIYPDFTVEPIYTDGGEPFVTMMQDACAGYEGDDKKHPTPPAPSANIFGAARSGSGSVFVRKITNI